MQKFVFSGRVFGYFEECNGAKAHIDVNRKKEACPALTTNAKSAGDKLWDKLDHVDGQIFDPTTIT